MRMKESNGWINALFSLVFVAAPAMVMFYFLLPDWADIQILTTGEMWAVTLGFIAYSALLNFLLIKFEFLPIDSINFNGPLTLVLAIIFISFGLDIWVRALLMIIGVLLAFPTNVYVAKMKEKKIRKLKQGKKE